eukprot:5819368-Amphidinium_carterae.1
MQQQCSRTRAEMGSRSSAQQAKLAFNLKSPLCSFLMPVGGSTYLTSTARFAKVPSKGSGQGLARALASL